MTWLSKGALNPNCETCIGYKIDGGQIPTCIGPNLICPKMQEYYPEKDAFDVRRAVWTEFSNRIEPVK